MEKCICLCLYTFCTIFIWTKITVKKGKKFFLSLFILLFLFTLARVLQLRWIVVWLWIWLNFLIFLHFYVWEERCNQEEKKNQLDFIQYFFFVCFSKLIYCLLPNHFYPIFLLGYTSVLCKTLFAPFFTLIISFDFNTLSKTIKNFTFVRKVI